MPQRSSLAPQYGAAWWPSADSMDRALDANPTRRRLAQVVTWVLGAVLVVGLVATAVFVVATGGGG